MTLTKGFDDENRRKSGAAATLLAAGAFAAGCHDGLKTGKPDTAAKTEDHPDRGPHGGALAEWGEEEYHAEFTADHANKQATIYILDGTAKKAAPVAAENVT